MTNILYDWGEIMEKDGNVDGVASNVYTGGVGIKGEGGGRGNTR